MTPRRAPQCASSVLMVRPAAFRANAETAESNAFQTAGLAGSAVAEAAVAEFDALAAALAHAGVEVLVLPGRPEADTPDELFPNNWLSLHADGTAVLYPMAAPSRRRERRADALAALHADRRPVQRLIDLRAYECTGRFLEGTGSLVMDHVRGVAWACRSPRTDPAVAADLCLRMGLELQLFDAADARGVPIYHTNVMLSVGERFAAVCLEAVTDAAARERLRASLALDDREVIGLSFAQLDAFAGNLLQLRGTGGSPLIVLSATSFASLSAAQRARLAAHGRLLPVAVPTIERAGGGSVRCMIAEVFLPRSNADGA